MLEFRKCHCRHYVTFIMSHNVHNYIYIVYTNINKRSMTNSPKLTHKVGFCLISWNTSYGFFNLIFQNLKWIVISHFQWLMKKTRKTFGNILCIKSVFLGARLIRIILKYNRWPYFIAIKITQPHKTENT